MQRTTPWPCSRRQFLDFLFVPIVLGPGSLASYGQDTKLPIGEAFRLLVTSLGVTRAKNHKAGIVITNDFSPIIYDYSIDELHEFVAREFGTKRTTDWSGNYEVTIITDAELRSLDSRFLQNDEISHHF